MRSLRQPRDFGRPDQPGALRRRDVLRLGLGMAGMFYAGLGHGAEPPHLVALKTLAAKKGLLFGSASDVEILKAPEQYRALFAAQCDLFAPILSWGYVAPEGPQKDPGRSDPNTAFAAAQGMKLTGAHLLWHLNTPAWFASLDEGAAAKGAAAAHIRAMMQIYRGQTFSWNVVNEALDPRSWRLDGLRESVLLRKLGPDFIEFAFRVAHDADPKMLLAYNDYDMETDHWDHVRRRISLLKLLERLKARDVPIGAIGLQSHLRIDGGHFDAKRYRRFLTDIASFGVRILITELDVLDLDAPADYGARDRLVADRYLEFLEVALDETAVAAVTCWGLADQYSWLNLDTSGDFRRKDDQPGRPLLFDTDFTPKPSFFAVARAFNGAPTRPPLLPETHALAP